MVHIARRFTPGTYQPETTQQVALRVIPELIELKSARVECQGNHGGLCFPIDQSAPVSISPRPPSQEDKP